VAERNIGKMILFLFKKVRDDATETIMNIHIKKFCLKIFVQTVYTLTLEYSTPFMKNNLYTYMSHDFIGPPVLIMPGYKINKARITINK
jgi:hypothetical protein